MIDRQVGQPGDVTLHSLASTTGRNAPTQLAMIVTIDRKVFMESLLMILRKIQIKSYLMFDDDSEFNTNRCYGGLRKNNTSGCRNSASELRVHAWRVYDEA